jgi:hypothetical protein
MSRTLYQVSVTAGTTARQASTSESQSALPDQSPAITGFVIDEAPRSPSRIDLDDIFADLEAALVRAQADSDELSDEIAERTFNLVRQIRGFVNAVDEKTIAILSLFLSLLQLVLAKQRRQRTDLAVAIAQCIVAGRRSSTRSKPSVATRRIHHRFRTLQGSAQYLIGTDAERKIVDDGVSLFADIRCNAELKSIDAILRTLTRALAADSRSA